MGFKFLKDTVSIVCFKWQTAAKFCVGDKKSGQLKDVRCKTKRTSFLDMMHMVFIVEML